MKKPSLFAHLRAIFFLPFTVTVLIPSFIYNEKNTIPFSPGLLESLSTIFFLPGLFLFIYTIFLFRKRGKGTLAPWNATQKLVVAGPYKYCRNPMITGVLFILLGEAFAYNSSDILWWAFIFFIINNFYFLFKEEPDLAKRFGEDYKKYKENVPRWIPRLKPYRGE